MFDETQSILTTLVESMLPRFSGKLALRFRLRMDQDYYGERKPELRETLRDSWCVEYVVTRPSNYTKVYMKQGPFGSFGSGPFSEECGPWMFIADHDSCWREAFDRPSRIAAERRQPFLDAGLEWHEVSQHASFDMFQGQPCYVHLEAEPAEPEPTGDARIKFYRNAWMRKVPHNLTMTGVPLHKIHTYLNAYRREQREQAEATT